MCLMKWEDQYEEISNESSLPGLGFADLSFVCGVPGLVFCTFCLEAVRSLCAAVHTPHQVCNVELIEGGGLCAGARISAAADASWTGTPPPRARAR